ncbi:Cytochrome P450 monooxygenase [Lachnellula subtilissima]|uniref:Cytochrome P450 monooxygenase n=1 Tax=Lachnellula subtilissima TaxID=602034 RepID=A0A8H8RCN4_9HELO|nr:Cytochrome P450 monooxygenase [Lachnellula subtilissima]
MPSSEDFGFASLCCGLVGLYLMHAVYNLYFHPLRSFPGPIYGKVTGFWYISKIIQGNSFLVIKRLHDQYGDVVRIAPNELSYNTAEAWKSIYGRNIQLHGEDKASATGNRLLKDTLLYGAGFEGADTVVNAEGTFYAPQRRALAYAFTRKSLMTKEDLLTHYTDRAIANLTIQISAADTVDVGPMFANAIFDFNCKFVADRDIGASNPHGKVHPSVHYFDNILRFAYIPISLRRIPMIAYIQDTLQPFISGGLLHHQVVGPLIQNRLENGGSETDIISYMERHPKEGDTGKSQILNNAAIFIAAGTGTTVAWLCASVYYILSNPDVKSKLYAEIRNAASKTSDLNLDVVNSMKYLKAVTDESIRIFPPIVATLTRVVPRGGLRAEKVHRSRIRKAGIDELETLPSAPFLGIRHGVGSGIP